MMDSSRPPEFATTIESLYPPSVSLGYIAMPQGCGPAVGIPAATNEVFATWKISTRPSAGFVRYRLESLPLKIASAILPPNGSGRVMPATTMTVSISAAGAIGVSYVEMTPLDRRGGLGMSVVLFVKSQLRATAASHA